MPTYDNEGVKIETKMSDYENSLRELRMELARAYNAFFAGALVKDQVVVLEWRLMLLLPTFPSNPSMERRREK